MPRIVSLIASATEIVCALGFENDLVGRSHECDFPKSILELPSCTAPKFNVHGSSADIDQAVKATLQAATSVYSVDADLLHRLQPDVIVTQAQCEVCAVSLKDVEKAVNSWRAGSRERPESVQAVSRERPECPQIVTLNPNSLADVWSDIALVANALQVPDRGEQLIRSLQRRMTAIAAQAKTLEHPRVACLEWIDPLMAAGNWMPELVMLAGGVNLFGTAGAHSPWLSWEELCRQNPDVIVGLPCGFDLERTSREMASLAARPEWPGLRAVQTGRVFATDGNQFFNRPGPRLVESLEILAEIFHPEVFHFGHEGTGWRSFISVPR